MYIESMLSIICLIFALSLFRARSANEVVESLSQASSNQIPKMKSVASWRILNNSLKQISFLRILNSTDIDLEEQRIRKFLLLCVFLGLCLISFFSGFRFVSVILGPLFGVSFGYLLYQIRLKARDRNFNQEIIFFLPVVMERIVMAVQAGLDILPALKIIDQIETEALNKSGHVDKIDPVTLIFRRIVVLCESGFSFEIAANEVTRSIDNHALKHAIMHLVVAQKEGGEIIFPLRELSDATQLNYQENVEEQIATLPIKATLPLLVTFAGLIVTFMTGPVIQIMNVSANPKFTSQVATNPQQLTDRSR